MVENDASNQTRDRNEQRLLAIYRQMPPRQRKALLELLLPWDETGKNDQPV